MATAASCSTSLFLPLLLSHAYKDKDGQEAAIRASSLDWVIVRAAMLTNDPARRSVRAGTDLAGVRWRQDCTRRCRSVRGGATEHLVEANTGSFVVKDAESPHLMHDPEAVPAHAAP